jgi:hypothetical protein
LRRRARSWNALGVPVPAVRFDENLEQVREALLDVRPEFAALVGSS